MTHIGRCMRWSKPKSQDRKDGLSWHNGTIALGAPKAKSLPCFVERLPKPRSEVFDVENISADLVEKGWIQETFKSRDGGRYCIVGAIREIASSMAVEAILLDYTRQGIAQSCGFDGYIGLPEWNDRLGRTKLQVVNALTKASEIAAADGL
jgi:hypothetical protein